MDMLIWEIKKKLTTSLKIYFFNRKNLAAVGFVISHFEHFRQKGLYVL